MDRFARQDRRPQRNAPLMRKYEVASLLPDLSVRTTHHVAPDTPLFLNAFAAFGHGVMVSTIDGPIPVEDLQPGDYVQIHGGGVAPILWIGSTVLAPSQGNPTSDSPSGLIRILPDAFGLSRPMRNLLLGPAARLLQTRPAADGGPATQVLCPVEARVDGAQILQVTPPGPVRTYHLALRRHAILQADGIGVESYHPGPIMDHAMGLNTRNLFLSMFPHIEKMSDFGPLIFPRCDAAPDRTAA